MIKRKVCLLTVLILVTFGAFFKNFPIIEQRHLLLNLFKGHLIYYGIVLYIDRNIALYI